MPLTQLDSTVALVVIDLQKGIVSLPTINPIPGILANATKLTRDFREKNLPVVLVNVTAGPTGRTDQQRPARNFPPDWTDLAPELNHQPTDICISKQSVGAFNNTQLNEILRSRNVTQIVLLGVSTSQGVEGTARTAYDLGYNVVFAADAITDMDAENHRHATEKIFPRLGESDSTAAILAKLK
jgi:nicotinamidase-related amidase